MGELIGGGPGINPTDSQEWARRFAVLADPTRFGLLTHMHLHPHCTVSELAAATATSATTASQALKVLREDGLVSAVRDGRHMRYSLDDQISHYLLHLIGQHHAGQHSAGEAVRHT